MFNNSSKIMFFLILISGSLVSISANSWLGAWMGLEINLLSFIPLMSDNKNLMSTEASLKYFLTQALASVILLFGAIILLLSNNFFTDYSSSFSSMMIFSSLIMKSGAAPFHFWFPIVMEGLSWINSLILMTWQKIAPIVLLSYLMIKPLLIIVIIMSAAVGAIGGFNQTSLRKLMAFSSINHLGWMLASMYTSESLWISYFLVYSFISVNLVFLFKTFNVYHMNQLFFMFFNSKILKFGFFLNLLSLGGLPPFLGFMPKWLAIQALTLNNQMLLTTILVTSTLITLYFYLRMCYSAFMLNYFESNWIYSMNVSNFFMMVFLTTSFISSTGLFFIYLVYF